MSFQRKFTIWRNYSLLSAALIGAFWTVWYGLNGHVPIAEIALLKAPDSTIALPLVLSRWHDVFLGPLAATLLVPLFTNEEYKREMNDGDLYGPLIFALLLGFCLTIAMDLGLLGGIIFGLVALKPNFLLTYGLIYGLVCGLICGLVVGLSLWVFAGLIYGLAITLIALSKLVYSMPVWRRIGNWLHADNTDN